MNSQELRNLQEAYNQVHQLDEVLDTPERANEYARKNVRSMLGAFVKGVANKDISQLKTINKRKRGAELGKRKAERKAAEEMKEQTDIYDIILSHLLDEGYAETPEAAEAIMVNMSEEWRDSIVEEVLEEGEKPFPYEKVTTQQKKHSAAGNYGNMIKMGLAKRRAKEADKKGGSQQDAGKGWYHGK